MGKTGLNIDALAETMVEVQTDLAAELANFAMAAVKGLVPKDFHEGAAVGIMAVAIGQLHAAMMMRGKAQPNAETMEHLRKCYKCSEDAAEILVGKATEGGVTTFMDGIRAQLVNGVIDALMAKAPEK